MEVREVEGFLTHLANEEGSEALGMPAEAISLEIF